MSVDIHYGADKHSDGDHEWGLDFFRSDLAVKSGSRWMGVCTWRSVYRYFEEQGKIGTFNSV